MDIELELQLFVQSKPIMPFKKVKFMHEIEMVGIIRDMNFYLTPKNISFGTDVMRNYNERQIRNNLFLQYTGDSCNMN